MKTRLVVVGSLFLAGLLMGLSGCMLLHQEPTADFEWTQVSGSYEVEFDASGSTAHGNARIISYHWSFGDGATATGKTVTHTFVDGGRSYSVELRVTDDKGAIGCKTKSVAIEELPPIIRDIKVENLSHDECGAIFTCNWLKVTVDAFHPSGLPITIVIHTGDGRNLAGPVNQFYYKEPGTYLIRAVVTDSKGKTAEATKSVVVKRCILGAPVVAMSPKPNTAKLNQGIGFVVSASAPGYHCDWCLECNPCPPPTCIGCLPENKGIQRIRVVVEDPQGNEKSYEARCKASLSFSIAFDIPGTWKIRGTVLNSARENPRSTTFSHSVRVEAVKPPPPPEPEPNKPPVAAFTWQQVESTLTVNFDASGSYDPDGHIVSYNWSFAGIGTGQGKSTSFIFPTGDKSYSVTLTVTDNKGATGSTTQQVWVAGLPAPELGPQIRGIEVQNLNPQCGAIFTCNWLKVTVDAFHPSGLPITIVIHTGDGRNLAGPVNQFYYKEPGTYLIRAVVTDSKGKTAEATKSVVVTSCADVRPEARIRPLPPYQIAIGSRFDFTVEAWDPNAHCNWCLECNPCPPPTCIDCLPGNKGIRRIHVIVEGPDGHVEVYDVTCRFLISFTVNFNIPGTWKIRGVVWNRSQNTTFEHLTLVE